MPANTYGRQVVIPLTNKSGGSVAAGDVVIIDTTNNDAFTTTTSAAFTGVVGIAQETIANNAVGRVLLSGYAALVNVNASVTRGDFGATHTVVKQAASAGASRIAGTFCQFLTGGTTPDAVIFSADLGGGGGVTHTNSQVFLGADVSMPTANTFYDGPTYTPAAGTWLLICDAIVLNSAGGGQRETFKIWDGTTAYKAGQITNGATSEYSHLHLQAVVTASGSQVFKMSVAGNGGTQTMQRHPDTNNTGLTGLGTSLLAIKIA